MSVSDQTIAVESSVLGAAAGRIAQAGSRIRDGQSAVRRAAGTSFGGEPIEAAFSSMCARALSALGEISDTLDQLATNTAAAAEGYISTDHGVMPSSALVLHRSVFRSNGD